MSVHEQEAAEPLAVERVEQVADNGEQRLDTQRRAAWERRERGRQPERQHRQHGYAQRLRRVDRDALGEDVVGLERQKRVLLRRPERQGDPVVALEVLLDLHPIQVTKSQTSSSVARRRPSASKTRRRT